MPIISAPMMVPTTVPAPPNRLVPPSTAAAMTDNSSPSPSWKRPDCRRPAYSMPATAAAMLEMISTRILTPRVSTPL